MNGINGQKVCETLLFARGIPRADALRNSMLLFLVYIDMQPRLILFSIFVLLTVILFAQCKKMSEHNYSFLALGDSYTIGESVPTAQNFPHQAVELLQKSGYTFKAPEIIARTGWTTDELQQAINSTSLSTHYNIVTLLIGVNNQYRGYDINVYASEFENLLHQAIAFAGNDTAHVFVLSIPDWGVTPFAVGRDTSKIAQEIDAYNAINKKIALQYDVHYIDITPDTREAVHDNTLIAGDGLHPSGTEYTKWAEKLSEAIKKVL
jgi:lysophospholipase L1-like esterase